MSYLDDLKEKAKNLQDNFDIQSVEIGLLQNDMQDTLKPNLLLSELNGYVLEMMNDLVEYEKKNKLTARMQASKERLVKMLFVASELSGVGDKLQSFKLFNRELVGKIQLLRIENADLKNKLEICNTTAEPL